MGSGILYRWSSANAYGRQMRQAVDILEAAIRRTGPWSTPSTHKAVASAVKVIARADDSSGILGDACRRLLDPGSQPVMRAMPIG